MAAVGSAAAAITDPRAPASPAAEHGSDDALSPPSPSPRGNWRMGRTARTTDVPARLFGAAVGVRRRDVVAAGGGRRQDDRHTGGHLARPAGWHWRDAQLAR